MPTLSFDGRWMAYLSDETGRWEAYVRSLAGDGGVWQVSRGGAGDVFWSADGTRLYFGRKKRLYEVPVTFDPGFTLGPASSLPSPTDLAVVDSLPNGRRVHRYQRARRTTADRRRASRGQPGLTCWERCPEEDRWFFLRRSSGPVDKFLAVE